MKSILAFLLLLAIALGGMVVLAHHDTVAKLNTSYSKFAPVSASFSRFRGDKEHLASIYWRLHFAKKPRARDIFAYWSLRPFRHVTVVSK
ncbi:MAG: hypothetical protein ACR2G0_09125 [Chthoniobacterales bacterium]